MDLSSLVNPVSGGDGWSTDGSGETGRETQGLRGKDKGGGRLCGNEVVVEGGDSSAVGYQDKVEAKRHRGLWQLKYQVEVLAI